jgi:hypothetical protein
MTAGLSQRLPFHWLRCSAVRTRFAQRSVQIR